MIFSKIEIIDGEQYVKIEMLKNEVAKNKDLQQRIDKAIDYIEKEYYKEHDRPLENLCLKNCTYEPSLVVLGILKGED